MFKSLFNTIKYLLLSTEIQGAKVLNEAIKDYTVYKQNNHVDKEVIKEVVDEIKEFRKL